MSDRANKFSLYGLTRNELANRIVEWGFNPVHALPIWYHLYCRGATDVAEMADVPAKVRARLADEAIIDRLPIALETRSSDGFTQKYLLSLTDERRIETVLMKFTGRITACVSSQVGCAMGCVFCATGQMGFTRNLSASEIVAQVLHVRERARGDAPVRGGPADDALRNVVLMGMGEPLQNYDAVMKAVDILRDPNGLSLGAKKITLSTVGVVPGIVRLADEARPIHLAVSLHAATQAERAALVPLARKWPLDALIEACRYFSRKLERRIFFEWTLIEGKNDSVDQARAVGELLRGIPAQVNLIPLNPTSGYEGQPTRSPAVRRFQDVLAEFNLPSTVRQRRGIDIAAGCGQLATLERR